MQNLRSNKILITATTNIHIINFHLPYLEWFKSKGYEIHVACNGNPDIPFADKVWTIPFARKPLNFKNRVAYLQLKRIIKENNYELIHCHTPMGGIVTRLAARSNRKKGTRVIYTVHGFHFYKGSSFLSWLVFFPIELMFSIITDVIITINNEDFKLLKKKIFLSNGKFKTDGIGINPDRLEMNKYSDTEIIRKELGYKNDDFIILYIAEFIPRKNHEFIFKAIPEILEKIPKAKFLFAGGKSKLGNKFISYAKKHSFNKNINLLGYQTEIGKYIAISDVGISSSIAEGLPIGIAEIMSTGLPVVISNIRGHNELVINNENGFLFNKNDKEIFIEYLEKLYNNPELRFEIGNKGKLHMNNFKIEKPLKQTIKIYKKYLNSNIELNV